MKKAKDLKLGDTVYFIKGGEDRPEIHNITAINIDNSGCICIKYDGDRKTYAISNSSDECTEYTDVTVVYDYDLAITILADKLWERLH